MVRSWDARVRGAAEKAAPQHGERELESTVLPADTSPISDAPPVSNEAVSEPVVSERVVSEPVVSKQAAPVGPLTGERHQSDSEGSASNGAGSLTPAPPGQSERLNLHPPSEQVSIGPDQGSVPISDPRSDLYADLEGVDVGARSQIILEGQSTAIELAGLSMAIVDRDRGAILWRSGAWAEQFGQQNVLSRLWPSTTELGESPLPNDGESWKRVRSMALADGGEELIELALAGGRSESGSKFVTVLAIKSGARTQQIADRGEVIGIIEGTMQLARAGQQTSSDSGSATLHDSVRRGQPSGLSPDSFGQTVAVLYIDLDRFKVVHDLVGNLEAIRLLDLVGRRIRSAIRESDLFFRLPSDEFVVVATDLESPSKAEELAERVRSSIATLSDLGHDMALTASIGIALVEATQTGDELLAAAETAVYLAKGRGRNRVAVHDEELRARSQRLLIVERHLRRAIDRRDVRFAYQPVVNLATGKVIGAEALLRLGGEVGLSAIEVIQAAEHSGLMGALGALVVEGVNEQLSELLRDSDEEFVVMVNLSGTQLQDPALLGVLGRLAVDPTIPAGRLAVEVPEAVVDQNRAAFLHLCEVVRPSFKIGVDGFGTTLASDAILQSLPVDYIKLHRTVTANAAPPGAGRERAQQLIDLATSRGVVTIALGVEGAEQVSVLHAAGCLIGQGFLFAGAVAAPELLELIDVGFDGVDVAQENTSFSDW